MNILEIIIAPFLFVIKNIFLLSYQLTDNYGTSIILLSFIISLLLLPIFIFIEKAKNKDDIIKLKMKPLVAEIKRCYKGQERYYYLKTLNRQHNYSPLRSLIPILSLLLQIPFFIAAYQFLEGFGELSEVSFLFIDDLATPDALFGAINILPIIMTVVNLITAYFYTRNGDASERKQMLIVAGVFLVLLFNLPSGLVLYWTMNNVFSFFRLFITNPDVFRRIKKNEIVKLFDFTKSEVFISYYKYKVLFIIASIVAISSQVNWAVHNNFNSIVVRIVIAEILAVTITALGITYIPKIKNIKYSFNKDTVGSLLFYSSLFLAIYFYLSSILYYSGQNIVLLISSIIFIVITQFVGIKNVLENNNKISKLKYGLIISSLSVLFLFQLINFTDIIVPESSISNFLRLINDNNLVNIVLSGIVFVLITVPFVSKGVRSNSETNSNWILYILSIFYITGFVFLWNPLTIYSTFPETFDFAAIDILKNNFVLFAKTFVVLSFLYLVIPKKYKKYWLVVLLVITAISFVHNTVIPIDVGTLQENKFVKQNNLAASPFWFFIEGFALIAVAMLFNWLLKKHYTKQITIALILINIVLISQSFYESLNSGSFANKEYVSVDIPSSISFSRDKENIVFFISDMFHGYSIDSILKEEPTVNKKLDGFVWYPNTLSVSSITSTSISAMLGGFDYIPEKMNEDKEHTIGEKITHVTEQFRDKIKAKGYSFTSTPMIYSKIDKNTFDTYLPKWHNDWDRWNNRLNIGYDKELGHTILWENAAFYSAPLFLKPQIYNHGKWFHGDIKTNDNTNQAKPYNFLRLLPYLSDTINKKSSFIYIHSMASHHPWDVIDDSGKMHSDVSPYDNNKWVIQTLIKWIDWMKLNNVYDNTKIIIASDHGPHWGFHESGVNIKVPIIKNPKLKAWEGMVLCMNPLMLVKDFKSKGELKKDFRFMSNADACAIAFDENDPTKTEPIKDRELTTCYPKWVSKISKEKQFDIWYEYSVKGNYFDMMQWTVVIEK